MAKKNPPAAAEPKPKTKPTKPPPPLHPPYLEMISEAISSLKDRTGSSQQAISKFIEDKYKTNLPQNFKKILSVQLKKFAKSQKLVMVKNSFKLPASEKVKKAALDPKDKEEKEDGKKAKKMKRLSQVKTPSALKNKNKKKMVSTPKRVTKSINSPKPAVKKSRA